VKKFMSSLALASAGLLLVAGPASAGHEGAVYTGTLSEVASNDPGSPSGSVTLTVSEDGETMTAEITVSGMAPFPHAQHIHGIVEGDEVVASSCPTASADENNDGVVDVAEGAPSYGGIQVSLTTEGDTSPDSGLAVDRMPSGESYTYTRSGIPIPDALKPNLALLHIVIHGVDEDENGEITSVEDGAAVSSLDGGDGTLSREATLPALCGTLAVQATGAVQTGAGGTATDEHETLPGLGLRRCGESV
jgi:hypothetical protein